MALARLGGSRRTESYTWPGFVDALATLLMVIIFVLMVFVLIQVNLAYRVSGQDETLGEMRQQLASLTELLNLERQASSDLAADLAQISSQLETTTAERDDILSQLAAANQALAVRDTELAAREAELTSLNAEQAATLAALQAASTRLEERLAALNAVERRLALTDSKLQDSEKAN
ncbi:MAG: flagellar motor protein, partial [Alphaproteobacteria bacterium]